MTAYMFAEMSGADAWYSPARRTWHIVPAEGDVSEVYVPSGTHRWDALLGMYPDAREVAA